jgi:hypothetical protein
MRPLDVGHGLCVEIQPDVTEDGVPTPADELMDYDQSPDREMIDLRVHKRSWPIIRRLELPSQADSALSSDVDLTRVAWQPPDFPDCNFPR